MRVMVLWGDSQIVIVPNGVAGHGGDSSKVSGGSSLEHSLRKASCTSANVAALFGSGAARTLGLGIHGTTATGDHCVKVSCWNYRGITLQGPTESLAPAPESELSQSLLCLSRFRDPKSRAHLARKPTV